METDHSGTVLVVDDDMSMRSSLRRLLTINGWTVDTFETAEEFLGSVLPYGVCCVLLDMRLPGLTGLEAQKAFNDTHREIPIIYITGYGTVPESVQAMKEGAYDFIEKPFNEELLIGTVRKALRASAAHLLLSEELKVISSRYQLLTPREREVFALVTNGLLNKQIAFELGTSEKTIKVHRGRVMRKMQAESLADLVRFADRLDISRHHLTELVEH